MVRSTPVGRNVELLRNYDKRGVAEPVPGSCVRFGRPFGLVSATRLRSYCCRFRIAEPARARLAESHASVWDRPSHERVRIGKPFGLVSAIAIDREYLCVLSVSVRTNLGKSAIRGNPWRARTINARVRTGYLTESRRRGDAETRRRRTPSHCGRMAFWYSPRREGRRIGKRCQASVVRNDSATQLRRTWTWLARSSR